MLKPYVQQRSRDSGVRPVFYICLSDCLWSGGETPAVRDTFALRGRVRAVCSVLMGPRRAASVRSRCVRPAWPRTTHSLSVSCPVRIGAWVRAFSNVDLTD